ncbi:MAG: 50S ribosomal protein L16 [Candidatus Magasanikbacteria bacterium RIFCSPHIGHO2_01_FULL_50_8]|jgi:large subunit ribosomal protein L16|uniref:Large ribosomal subunit protein uL16 n=2 Tax=Candidatus Magasanikiibacteriota TaxID=1752731 RepID=A0A1F6LR37_9BACT|nr:MAG: 50S ribosomal protein L16 [Candidatus Magasanikbacteria bacterium RIFCSPHIGHO2_01_FULL_50_8]OGH67437.1 MAG: 50S ribosomal protein L16 [Candidatus Magasanikbacteria bacterium RIFCSPHIGHO2_02_FULL_50_9b]
MLIPRKVKHRKWHKGRRRNTGVATSKTTVAFGTYGLKATTYAWITSRQIESVRKVLTRYTKKSGKIWIRIFPDKPITAKGAETPMGKGKGSVDHYVTIIKPGTIMFEMDGITPEQAHEAFGLAGYKLPVKTTLIKRHT